MKKILEIAVILSAVDKMSAVINGATDKSIQKLQQFHQKQFTDGLGMMGAGAAGFAALAPAIDAFSDLEDSALQMKSTMLQAGNTIDEKFFQRVNDEAIRLGNLLPGTTADMHNLFTVMLRNGVTGQQILDGVGQSAAFLGVQLKIPYTQAGELAARLKNSTGTANKDMMELMDTISRIAQVGPNVDEVTYAFQRASGGMKALNIQGIEQTKIMGNLIAQMIQGGMGTGETIGTGFKAVFNEMLNPKSMKALNEQAAKLGLNFKFFDNQGTFLGLTNFVEQMDKMKGLDPVTIHKILAPLAGPQGNDLSILVAMAQKGVAGFNKMNDAIKGQATLQDKVKLQLTGLKNTWEATKGTFTNMLAAFGAAIAPLLKNVANLLNKVAGGIAAFAESNPKLFKFLALAIAGASTILMIAGAVKVFSAAMWFLNVAMDANPFILIGMGLVAIIAAVYVWWDKLKYVVGGLISVFIILNPLMLLNPILLIAAAFVGAAVLIYKNWDKVKRFFVSLWDLFKDLYHIAAFFNPLLRIPILIIRHWDKIKEWFSSFIGWIKGWAKPFYDAGANIINSMVSGIKSAAHKAWNAIRDVVKGMRDYLPFSPAKTGPFKDLHKIKIIQTIADNMSPRPMVNAMRAAAFATVAASGSAASASGGGGGMTIHYAPTVTISAGANKEDFLTMLKQHERDLVRVIEDVQKRNNRTKF